MRRAARIDNTAKDLRAYAESIGFLVMPINGVIDCVLFYGTRAVVIDWKAKDGALTPAQSRLIARGAPIHFVSRPEQLDALKAEMSR